jgi:segregation and condensation protein A
MQGNAETFQKEFGNSIQMVSVSGSPSDELDGIEILVSMAKQGKIDPWNIDIVDITDKYLLHLAESKSNNLRLTGRTLLFAAILLKIKSNILEGIDPLGIEEGQDESFLDYDDDFGDDYEEEINTNNVISLDEVLQRRTSIRLNRNRVVTLKDLIKQLQFYEELDRKQSLKNTLERAKRRVKSYAKLTSDDIINLAHDEYIERSIKVLHENLIRIFEQEERIELNTLTLLGLDKISAYIALLFLSAETDIELVQEEFYSDLYVVKEKPKQMGEIA